MDRRVYDNYVLKVAEYGTLTKAAAALGISQPALSSGLSSLEKEVGIRIFNRRSVPISFTPEGLVYFEYIKRLNTLADDFAVRIEALHEAVDRKVTIGAPAAYVETIVTDAVIRLLERDPDLKVCIKSAPLEDLITMASEGQINCFISTSDSLPDHFEKHFVRNERLYLVIPANDPINQALTDSRVRTEQNGETYDFSLLDHQAFVFLEENKPLQKKIEVFLKNHRIEPKNSIVVDQVSTAVNLSVKGAGICFSSEEFLTGNAAPEHVRVYPLPLEGSERKIFVAFDQDLYQTKACKELVSLLTGPSEVFLSE